jgi:hypothetical protein
LPEAYAHAKMMIERINKINGLFLLFTFLTLINFVSENLVEVLDEGNFVVLLLIINYSVLYFATFYLAAETNHNVITQYSRLATISSNFVVYSHNQSC